MMHNHPPWGLCRDSGSQGGLCRGNTLGERVIRTTQMDVLGIGGVGTVFQAEALIQGEVLRSLGGT